jgi:hypothetical protein
MAITNGYCTLAELKARLYDTKTYSATTISFSASGSSISDTAGGLGQFDTGEIINVTTASGSNTGNYTIATGGNNSTIVVTGTFTALSSGSLTTITSANKDDNTLEAIITAVSRRIDKYAGRRFYTTTADETRYFTAEFQDVIDVNDIVSITTLATDDDGDGTFENTWTGGSVAQDYNLMPYNASLESEPYTYIEIAENGDYYFPTHVKRGVKVVGKFGWSSCPDAVREACILQSVRLLKRKDAPFGIAGTNEFGTLQIVPKLDPDVMFLLEPYTLPFVGGI